MATLRVAPKPEAAKMKAAQIAKPGAEFEIVERPIPELGTGEVRIKVQACGICHSDVLVKDGLIPWIQYPRIPGHELPHRRRSPLRASTARGDSVRRGL